MTLSAPTASLAITWALDTAASDPIVNVLFFRKSSDADDFTIPELGSLIADVGAAWTDTVGTVICSDMKCQSVTARAIVPGPTFSLTLPPPLTTWVNDDTGQATAPWQNVVCNHQSDNPGRSGKGRTYLAGFRDEFVDSSGTIDATFRGQLQDAWLAFQGDVVTGGSNVAQAVYSRKDNSEGIVIGTLCRPLVGIQRDRRSGSN